MMVVPVQDPPTSLDGMRRLKKSELVVSSDSLVLSPRERWVLASVPPELTRGVVEL